MKKVLLFITVLVFGLALAGCGDKKLDCADNEFQVGDSCVGLDNMDDLNPDQITELLLDEYDGGLSHLVTAMEGMDMSNGYESNMEMTFTMSESGETMYMTLSQTQKVSIIDGKTSMYQSQEMDTNGMGMASEMYMIETDTGVDMYYNLGGLLDAVDSYSSQEIQEQLDAFNVSGDWVMFHVANDLADVAEFEAAKDFLIEILEDEFGVNKWNEMQAELEAEAGFDLNQYGFSIPAMGGLLENSDYDALITYLENVDFEGILAEAEVSPGDELNVFNQTLLQAAIDNLDHQALLVELETFDVDAMLVAMGQGEAGFNTYLNTLTDYPQVKSILAPFAPALSELTSLELDQIEYIGEELYVFDKYFTTDYFVNQELLAVNAVINDQNQVVTTVTLDPESFPEVFEEFVTDAYWFAYDAPGSDVGYVEGINCPSAQYCDPFIDFSEVTEQVMGLDEITAEFVFDPNNDKSMTMSVDIEDFVQSLADKESYSPVNVSNANMSMTMKEGAVVTPPASAFDLQNVLDDVLALSFVEELRYDIGRMDEMARWNSVPNGTYSFMNYPEYNRLENPAFDEVLSTITVEDYDLEITLYWIDGTPVFDQPMSNSDFDMLWEDNMYAPTFTRANLLNILGILDEDNVDSGRIAVFMMFE